MVATDACSRATCDSSAIVTLSRKPRCTRVLIVRKNQVAAADTPSATAATITRLRLFSIMPSPKSLNHSARSASGSAAKSARKNTASSSRGSWRYPSLHNRHIDDKAGGKSSGFLGEDVIGLPLFVLGGGKALRLKVEHRAVATGFRHQ